MAFTALVTAIVNNIHDPDNHCNSSLIHTLKKEIVNDLTNAYVKSEPLVSKYASLYIESKSFLDFILRFCDLTPPKPSRVDSSSLQCRIDELEKTLKECSEQQSPKYQNPPTDDSKVQELQKYLDDSKQQQRDLQHEIESLKKSLKECNEKRATLVEEIEKARGYNTIYLEEQNKMDKALLKKSEELEKCERERNKYLKDSERLEEDVDDLNEQLKQYQQTVSTCKVCRNESIRETDQFLDAKEMEVEKFNDAIAESSIDATTTYLKNISEAAHRAEEQCKQYLKELNESNAKQIQLIREEQQKERQTFEQKLAQRPFTVDYDELSKKMTDLFTRTLQISELSNAIEYIKTMKETFTAPQITMYDPNDLNRVLTEARNILGDMKTVQGALEGPPTNLAIMFPPEQMMQFETVLRNHLDSFKTDVLAKRPMYDISEINTAFENGIQRLRGMQQTSGLFNHPAIEGRPPLQMLIAPEQLKPIVDSISSLESQVKLRLEEFQKSALPYDPTALNEVLRNASVMLENIKTTQVQMNESNTKLAALMPSATHLAIGYPQQLATIENSISNLEGAVKNQLDQFHRNTVALIPSEAIDVIKEKQLQIETHFNSVIDSMKQLPWYTEKDAMTEFLSKAGNFVTLMSSFKVNPDNLLQGQAISYDASMDAEEASTSYGVLPVSKSLVALKQERDELEKEIMQLKSKSCDCQILRSHFMSNYGNELAGREDWVKHVMHTFNSNIQTISNFHENIQKLRNIVDEEVPYVVINELNFPEQMKSVFNRLRVKYQAVECTFDTEIEELKRYAKVPALPKEEFIKFLRSQIDRNRELRKLEIEKEAADFGVQYQARNRELQQDLNREIEKTKRLEQDLKAYEAGDLKAKTLKRLYREFKLEKPEDKYSTDDFLEKLNLTKLKSLDDLERQCIQIINRLDITLEPKDGLNWHGFEDKVIRKLIPRKRERSHDAIKDEDEPRRKRLMNFEYYEASLQRDGKLINDLADLIKALYIYYFKLLWTSGYRKVEPIPENTLTELTEKLIILASLKEDKNSTSFYFEVLQSYVQYDLGTYNGQDIFKSDSLQKMNADDRVVKLLQTCMNDTENLLKEAMQKLNESGEIVMYEQDDTTPMIEEITA